MLGVELVCAFLPQTERFVPFAAFFVAACLVLCIPDRTRKTSLCLLLGAAAGMAAAARTDAQWSTVQKRYAGRPVVLTAEVETVSPSWMPDAVEAVLRVETVNGAAADLRVKCEQMPECKAGQQVRGRFVLSAPAENERVDWYTDGIALAAVQTEEAPDFAVLGQSGSFRARTHRLQQRLSASLRRCMDGGTGGVLAAMTVGDRTHLSDALRNAYRGAGLSHVLVVSGMHVSVLCGDILGTVLPYEWEISYRRRKRRALSRSLLALVLMGVTGFTPSVCRAAVSVWVSALGVWVYGAPDALTSLAAAGILMTARNSYAVCDIGFELSFAAVLGTVAGGACIFRLREWWCRRFWKRADQPVRRPWFLKLPERLWGLAESVCISFCASAAAFPVLVLRGLSVSVWAVASGAAVLWMIQPMLLLGLGAAFTGLVPLLAPVYRVLSRAAVLLTGLLNAWAVWISAKPGAGIYFDTAYSACVCLVLIGLSWLAFRWRVRVRTALPCILLTAVVACGLGNALSRDVVHIDLVGTSNAPAVVVSQNDTAVVLFRGGASTQRRVENQLAKRGVRTVELLVDLRTKPAAECTLGALRTVRAQTMQTGTSRDCRCTPAQVEVLRTRSGCLVRLTVGQSQLLTLSGTVELAKPVRAEWLLASPARPDAVRCQKTLALQTYDWMKGDETLPSTLSLRRNSGENAG